MPFRSIYPREMKMEHTQMPTIWCAVRAHTCGPHRATPGVHQSDATSEPTCLGIEPHPVWRGWSGSVLLPEVAAAECEPSISPARDRTWPTLSQGSSGIFLQELCLLTAAKHSLMPSQRLLKVKGTQSCQTLCDPMDYTVHGILLARILEWVAFPFSRGSSQPRN